MATISIDLDILDPAKLFQAAADDYVTQNEGRDPVAIDDEISDFLGTSTKPKLEACLRQLYDRPRSVADGVTIQNSSVSLEEKEGRLSTVLHLSTAHIPADERQLINDALCIANEGFSNERALVHADYCGLYLKPKSCGWFVRVPTSDDWPLNPEQFGLTPAMRTVIEYARSYGAWMIDFDVDEEPIESLPYYDDDLKLIIKDLTSVVEEGDEPLYWSNEGGWVDRESADRFSLVDAMRSNLPEAGSNPIWVDAADTEDKQYKLPA